MCSQVRLPSSTVSSNFCEQTTAKQLVDDALTDAVF